MYIIYVCVFIYYHLNNSLRLVLLFITIANPVINFSSLDLSPVGVTQKYLSNMAVSVFHVTKIRIPPSPDGLL